MRAVHVWFGVVMLVCLGFFGSTFVGYGAGQEAARNINAVGRFHSTVGRTEKGAAFILMTDTCTGATWVYRFNSNALENRQVDEWQTFTKAPWER